MRKRLRLGFGQFPDRGEDENASSIDFQIASDCGMQIQGEALVQQVANQIGNDQKRYVLMRLCLIEANVVEGPVSAVLSLT